MKPKEMITKKTKTGRDRSHEEDILKKKGLTCIYLDN